MTVMRVLSLLSIFCAVLAVDSVQAQDLRLTYQAEESAMSVENGQVNFALPVEGLQDTAELSFFVKSKASERANFDLTADELNRIAPAAGIQLKFDLEY